MADSKFLAGLASAAGVIFIWSGFIVFSRAGVQTALTAFDISALRFSVAGAMVLPFAVKWWPRHLPLKAQAILALSGPGAAYSMMMYLGLNEASAAYAGVFSNGSMPIFTVLLALFFAGERPGPVRIAAISVIVGGGVLLAWRGLNAGGDNILSGIALFVAASALLSVYVYGLKYWMVKPKQALVLVNLPNALLFLPVWWFFLPSGLAEADTGMIVFQALFQGLGPGFIAVILYAIAATNLGPTPTAGFSAAIPATAAILAMPVLGEFPTPLEWLGIVVVCIGMVMLFMRRGAQQGT